MNNRFKIWFSKFGWIILVAVVVIGLATLVCFLLNFNPFAWLATKTEAIISLVILLFILIVVGAAFALRLKNK